MGKEIAKVEKWKTDLRLSPGIQPTLYNLFLNPDIKTGTFEGRVNISLSVKSQQDYIAVHIKGLNITGCEINAANETSDITIKESFEYKQNEFWVIITQEPIPVGKYSLRFNFKGDLKGKIVGFYRSQYTDDSGNKRSIVTSKFEPTFARQAFPCFDEPSFKAEYNIELVRPSGDNFIALSNTKQKGEIPDYPEKGFTTVQFETTVPMSTYLACFIVCDFGNLTSAIAQDGFPVTVYARNDQVQNMEYARDMAVKVVDYYTSYFGIPYPLSKLDLIAIPDFVSGAMENWGLITFRETSILYNPNITSTGNKFRVSQTTSHEIAHMWFGNLVTMKWWNDLWLNEGYASYMEYKGVSAVHPEWDLDAMFLVHDLHTVLELDATLNSHPIVAEVNNPDQITEIFDRISYNKGASVIRMLEATIGEDAFRQGVSSYLKEFQYKNAETNDLWRHMQKFSAPECDVTQFMDTFTRQMGYPLITVSRTESTVTFTQSRYLADPEAEYDSEKSPFEYRWDIPITYIISSSSSIGNIWLSKDNESVSVQIPSDAEWMKVNIRQAGYYRVNYSADEWLKLTKLLIQDTERLQASDRASLLNDAFNLAEAELIPYDIPLNMTGYLDGEQHFVPWSVAASEFSSLRKRLLNTTSYDAYKVYVQKKLENAKNLSLNFEGELDFLQKYLQTTLFNLGCSVSHPDYIMKANETFTKFLRDTTTKLNPNIAATVYYYGIQSSGETEWNKLWQVFLKEQNPQEKLKMMIALCASNDTSTLKRYLQLAKNQDYVRSQDFFNLLAYVGLNPIGTEIVWNFIREEWNYLVDRFTLSDRYLGQMVSSVTSHFATPEKLQEMKSFFEKNPDAGAGTNSRKQALETVQLNIKWRQKHLATLTDWFQKAS